MINLIWNKWGFMVVEIIGVLAKIREMLGSFEMEVDPFSETMRIVILVVFILIVDLVILPETEDR